jgi:hypothetical protein
MAQQPSGDPVVARLDAILMVLQDLFIIESARTGLTKATVRAILGVNNTRISQTWKHLKAAQKKSQGI